MSAECFDQKCYEDFYCARGNMENQIKQQYLDLDADRTSTHWMASNLLRFWFSAFALLLFRRLRTLGLQGTELALATAGSIRQRLLKIGAMVTVSTRRVYIRTSTSCSVRIGVRRGLRPPPQLQHFQWVATRRPVGVACPESIKIPAPTAPQPTGKSNPITNSAIQGFIQALDVFVNTPRSDVVR